MQSLSILGVLFANIGYLVTAFYAFINLVAVILYELIGYEPFGAILDVVLGIDVVTWPIYCIFTVVTFLITVFIKKDPATTKKKFTFWWLSHLILMLISFICLSIIFDNSF